MQFIKKLFTWTIFGQRRWSNQSNKHCKASWQLRPNRTLLWSPEPMQIPIMMIKNIQEVRRDYLAFKVTYFYALSLSSKVWNPQRVPNQKFWLTYRGSRNLKEDSLMKKIRFPTKRAMRSIADARGGKDKPRVVHLEEYQGLSVHDRIPTINFYKRQGEQNWSIK